jgi:phosphate transport system substrate-binding protein
VISSPRSGTWLRTIVLLWLGALAGFAIGIEWIRSRPEPLRPSGGIDLVGAGATFPYPLYRRWFADYGAESGVRINYFSIGSAEGVRLVLEGDADFGATDRPLTSEETSRATCGVAQFPTVAGAIAVAYNLPGLTAPLRLDAPTLAGIFAGRITRWNAAQLRALNPGVALPALAIRPVQRVRVTGTAAAFAQYLSTAAAGSGESVLGVSPGTARVEGNEGVIAELLLAPGTIGAVELTYAEQARMPVALLRNASGAWVAPSAASVAAAAAELLTPASADTLSGLVGARDSLAYPAVVLTRIVVDAAMRDETRGAHFVAFARWALTEGAQSAVEFGYAPLPSEVARVQLQRLDALRPGRCAVAATPDTTEAR